MTNVSRIMLIATLVLCGVFGRSSLPPVASQADPPSREAVLASHGPAVATPRPTVSPPREIDSPLTEQFGSLRKGMTRAEVETLLGRPDEEANEQQWFYRHHAADGTTYLYSVQFTGEAVSGYSRMTYRRPARDPQ